MPGDQAKGSTEKDHQGNARTRTARTSDSAAPPPGSSPEHQPESKAGTTAGSVPPETIASCSSSSASPPQSSPATDKEGDDDPSFSSASENVKAGATPVTASSSLSSARGPQGPRPGVYRPCARCRVKKTKCDRVKPSCSNCDKAGPDAFCVYDNDEPTPGVLTASLQGSSSLSQSPATTTAPTPTAVTATSEQPNRKGDSAVRKSASQDGSSSSSPKSKGTGATNTGGNIGNNSSSSTAGSKVVGNGHSTRSSDKSKKATYAPSHTPSPIGATTSSSSATNAASATTTAGQGSEDIEPPQKKIKTGSGLGENVITTMKSSPLRSSVTTARVSIHGTKKPSQPSEDSVDIETLETETVEDGVVSELSVADATKDVKMEDAIEANDDSRNPNGSIVTPQAASGTGGGAGASRSKKQYKGITSTSGGSTPTRIMADPPTTKPPPPFVIDKNQRARKWGRSNGVFQTLGGNSATATNLARIAVLNQMDNGFYNYDTPERGSTPETKKMKVPQRGIRKSHGAEGVRVSGVSKFARARAGSEAMQVDDGQAPTSTSKGHSGKSSLKRKGTARIMADEDAENSSARSTPGPSAATPTTSTGSKPRPIPTRPRTFPCSFEGCTKSFMDKFHLKRHEKRHVTQVITCGVDGCTKAYDSISTMRRHQSMMHRQWKEEMEAAAAANAAAAYAARERDRTDGDGDGDGGEEDGVDGGEEAESTPSSPSLSATPFTAASSPMREQV
ncbi:hypothetical protein BGW39_001127 [Mortierella sp. 14UC]|nr:hypothetical protein BGW39_001127 [Mortierella sp. 14UC]